MSRPVTAPERQAQPVQLPHLARRPPTADIEAATCIWPAGVFTLNGMPGDTPAGTVTSICSIVSTAGAASDAESGHAKSENQRVTAAARDDACASVGGGRGRHVSPPLS